MMLDGRELANAQSQRMTTGQGRHDAGEKGRSASSSERGGRLLPLVVAAARPER